MNKNFVIIFTVEAKGECVDAGKEVLDRGMEAEHPECFQREAILIVWVEYTHSLGVANNMFPITSAGRLRKFLREQLTI